MPKQVNVISGASSWRILLSIPGMNKVLVKLLYGKNKRLYNIKRVLPPTKGVFVNMIKKFGVKKVLNWTLSLKELLLQSLVKKAARDPRYQGLVDLEKFQFNQKGPVSPVEARFLIDEVLPKIHDSSMNIVDVFNDPDLVESVHEVDEILNSLGLYNQIELNSINFAEKFKELPSSSVRGLPFLKKGKDVDDTIIKEYGSDLPSVLRVFLSIDYLVATLGLRLQGSPGTDPAKVRAIFIPLVQYVYFMNGVYKTVQDLFKNNWDCFLAWKDPVERDKGIIKMVDNCLSNDWRMLSLDYRQYDMHLPPALRFAATNLVFKCFKDNPHKKTILNKINQLYHNQYLCAPYGNDPLSLIKVDNQLMSGVPNTQLDGSLINLILQRFIARKLGYKIPSNWGLALGDDTGLPIPLSILEKFGGYEKTLKYIKEEILNPLGMDSHDKKAYPNDNLLFLQNLYQPQDDILAQYSILRTVDSLVWAEQFREEIEGIKNSNALETIGQITIVNNPVVTFGSVNEIPEVKILIRRWLEVDNAFFSLAQECLSRGNPVNYLMNYLISASGGRDVIVRAFRLKQSDNKGILNKLDSGTFSESFPVIPLIFEVVKSMNLSRSDFASVYEQKTSPEFDVVDRNRQLDSTDLV